MSLSMRNFISYVLILLLPTQIGKHFFFYFSYINGIRVDYLSLAFYLTDAVSLILIMFHWRIILEFVVNFKKYFFILIVLLFSNAIVSMSPALALYQFLRIFQIIFLFVIFSKITLSKNHVIKALLAGGVVALILTILQLYKKSSIQGFFYFLGERLMDLSTPGIAKASLGGTEFLRPYATFSHPNSMAGFYLLVFMFVLTMTKSRKDEKSKTFLYFLTLAISASLVFISISKATVAIFLVISGIYLLRNRVDCSICIISKAVVPLVLSLNIFTAKTDPLSFNKRLYLFKSSLQIIKENFLFGTGLGQYLLSQAHYINPYSYFFLQPVHNVFLLFFAESGIFLSIFVIFVIWRFIKSQENSNAFFYCLAVVVATGAIDHYWLTLQQNLLLLPVIFGILKKNS